MLPGTPSFVLAVRLYPEYAVVELTGPGLLVNLRTPPQMPETVQEMALPEIIFDNTDARHYDHCIVLFNCDLPSSQLYRALQFAAAMYRTPAGQPPAYLQEFFSDSDAHRDYLEIMRQIQEGGENVSAVS